MSYGKWHGGKGGFRRKSKNSDYVDDLRWELWKSTTPPERKEEIKRELEQLENDGDDNE